MLDHFSAARDSVHLTASAAKRSGPSSGGAPRPNLTLAQGEWVRVEAKGQARYWTVQDHEVLVGRTLAELVAVMRAPTLSSGALQAMAESRASIWLSPFEDVHRLTFGHELRVTPSGPRVHRWLRPDTFLDGEKAPAEVMRDAITRATERATRDETGATFALSGGLDSTTLLALTARDDVLRTGLRAYCAVPDPHAVTHVRGRSADEWPDASVMAATAGVSVERLVNPGTDWLGVADDFHERNLMPIRVPANLWWLRQLEQRAVRNGHRIIVTGQSGNATFSNGRPQAPRPLLPDGTWQQDAPRRRLFRTLRKLWRQSPPSAVGPGIPIRIADHILGMDPWTRWCLAEPPAGAFGPWTGADVEWRDPLGSPTVISAAWSLPTSAWGAKGSDRTLARQVARDLVPNHVRLSRVRGIQGADMPGMLRLHAASYAHAVDRVRQSPSAREFLDTDILGRSIALLHGDLRSARVFQQQYLKPLAVGLFAAWWDAEGQTRFADRGRPGCSGSHSSRSCTEAAPRN